MSEFFKAIFDTFAKFGRTLVKGGVAIAIFSIFWFFIAAVGTKFGLWDYTFGLMNLTFNWGRNIVMTALGLSFLGIVLSMFGSPRTQPFILGLIGILVSGLIMGRMIGFGEEAMRLPPIHDIQTDWDNPISFSETLMTIRGTDSNSVEDAPVIDDIADGRWPGYGGRLVSEVQEEAEWQPPIEKMKTHECAGVVYSTQIKEEYARENSRELKNSPYPYILDSKFYTMSVDSVFDSALKVVNRHGWKTVSVDRGAGKIEATDSTSWFGFEDDIAIRVLPIPKEMSEPPENCEVVEAKVDGIRPMVKVDVRSISRVGLSDIGTNAKRVNEFLVDLDRAVHRKKQN